MADTSGVMRVALLISANAWRGSGMSYAKIARGLRERGHLVHLVTAAPKVTHRLREEALEVTQIPGRDTGPREIWALRRVLQRLGADAIIADSPRDVRLSAYATILHRARILYRYNLNYRRARSHLMDRLYHRRVAAYVFQSRYIRDQAVEQAHWMERIPSYQVPNGYDTTRYAPNAAAGAAFRATHRIPPATKVVLSAAKLTRNKGQEVAIAALDLVRRSGTDVTYVVCGDGGRERELVSQAQRLGLPTRFTGLLGTEEMIAAFNAADLVVHPSLKEIFPNAVGEAMACGRPVVAADAGGTGELLGRDGSSGVLVPPEDPSGLAEIVRSLLDDPARRAALGEAARRRIEREYPLARMVDGYEAALKEVVGHTG
jgi:glycosyltransferase involved in cell wall biosynthesis